MLQKWAFWPKLRILTPKNAFLPVILSLFLLADARETGARIYPVRAGGDSPEWGFINRGGKLVVPLRLDDIGGRGENLVAARTAGKWGFLDERSGNWAITPRFSGAGAFSEGLAVVQSGGKWGYINARGEWKIKPRFVGRSDPFGFETTRRTFFGGLAAVEVSEPEAEKNRWPGEVGYIDKSGQWVITPRFLRGEPFRSGFARVDIMTPDFQSYELYTDRRGRLIRAPKNQEWLETYDFSEGLAAVKVKNAQGGLFGFIDATGKMVIPPRFLEVFGSDFLDLSGGFRDGVAMVVSGTTTENIRVGWIDKSGQWAIEAKFNGGGLSFVDGLAPVREGTEPGKGSGGYINRNGAYVIAPQFEKMGYFSDGLAPVQKPGEKWSYINRAGTTAIAPRFDYVPMEKAPSLEFMALQFHDGLAWVSENGTAGYIDASGRWIWKAPKKP